MNPAPAICSCMLTSSFPCGLIVESLAYQHIVYYYSGFLKNNCKSSNFFNCPSKMKERQIFGKTDTPAFETGVPAG